MRGRILRVIAATVVVTLVVLGVAGWTRAISLRHDSPASNAALVDAGRTEELVTAISQSLTQVLSYDYQDPGLTNAAADRVLTGPARDEHTTLFEELRKKAPGQKLVLSAEIQAAGVVTLSGDRATVLVFLDQSSLRAGDKEATVSAAQLSVSAVRVDGAWKISGLRPL
ncbi:nuclear transport factor 2 family protein [Nocardioides marmoriginsengisoli]|uniref:nuclear transport factor 2 family protein n=1 Tax=Nocardioides marmoriginsengisoli TaxID=661483 RepID=UPI0016228CC4|nr:nuclear transport factor 2 family protein [Nocardioides marmoriginsengisoli]